jgi:hypothetical protein
MITFPTNKFRPFGLFITKTNPWTYYPTFFGMRFTKFDPLGRTLKFFAFLNVFFKRMSVLTFPINKLRPFR